MSVAVRFAPSPTGNLHIGNARTAVLNWLFARKHKGHFLLRLDDTDTERSKPEYIENLYEDLKWLGLDYDQFVRQSDRLERYKEGQTKLIEAGYLYPCYETPEELERKRKVQLARKAPPIYDRAALSATQAQINQWKKEGRRPYWRFQLQEGIVSWNDFFKGALSFDLCNSVSDPVLVKEDGSFLYTLSSVIDDLDFNISHIIRGEDHVTNTGVQIQLINALGGQSENIIFAHLSLLLDQDGTPFSKRLQSFSLRNLRHMDPMAINCFLAGIGSNVSPYITDNVHDLAEHFSLENIRGGARVEEKSLYNIQKKIIRKLSFETAQQRYPLQMEGLSPEEWIVIREILDNTDDIRFWKNVFHTDFLKTQSFSSDDFAYLKNIHHWISHHDGTTDIWPQLQEFIKKELKRTGFTMAWPLRIALTGSAHGPELSVLISMLGKDRILRRLNAIQETSSLDTPGV